MRHIPDTREPHRPTIASSRAENAALYSCQPSMAALTQAFLEEHGDAGALACVVTPREQNPFEPFAFIICNAFIDWRRAGPGVSIPAWRAMPASRSPDDKDDQ